MEIITVDDVIDMNPEDREKVTLKDILSETKLEDFVGVSPDADNVKKYGDVSTQLRVIYMTMQGFSNKDICESINRSMTNVMLIKSSTEYKELRAVILNEIMKLCREYMAVGAMKAVKVLLECLESPNEKIKLAASTDILDRIGLKGAEKIEITNTQSSVEGMSTSDLAKMIGMGNDEIAKSLKGANNNE